MIKQGSAVLIDTHHPLFGGKTGQVQQVSRAIDKADYLVRIEGSTTLYPFRADELLIP